MELGFSLTWYVGVVASSRGSSMKELIGRDTDGWYRTGSKKDSVVVWEGEGVLNDAVGVLYTVYRESLRVDGVEGEGGGLLDGI